jgi:hypothetical protein
MNWTTSITRAGDMSRQRHMLRTGVEKSFMKTWTVSAMIAISWLNDLFI